MITEKSKMEKKYYSFKKLFFAYLFFTIPLSLLSGILGAFNVPVVYFNDAPVYGWRAIIITILFIPLIAGIASSFNWLILNIGVFLYDSFMSLVKRNNRALRPKS